MVVVVLCLRSVDGWRNGITETDISEETAKCWNGNRWVNGRAERWKPYRVVMMSYGRGDGECCWRVGGTPREDGIGGGLEFELLGVDVDDVDDEK